MGLLTDVYRWWATPLQVQWQAGPGQLKLNRLE